MSRLIRVAMAATLVTLAACADGGPAEPRGLEPDASPSLDAIPTARRVLLLDACDPTTFDAVLGAGSCVRRGGVTFAKFIQQLEQFGVAPAWRFDPKQLEIQVGQTFVAINHGGEVHTFTEVEEFGGGRVASLNTLSGNLVVAPECEALAGTDFIPPGGKVFDTPDEAGTEKYQCCIHPWMRSVVNVRERR
jgi:plastocyanin